MPTGLRTRTSGVWEAVLAAGADAGAAGRASLSTTRAPAADAGADDVDLALDAADALAAGATRGEVLTSLAGALAGVALDTGFAEAAAGRVIGR